MRKLILLLAIAVALAGCGGTDTAEPTQPEVAVSPAGDESPATTQATPSTETTDSSDVPAGSGVDGPPAPDFQLALSDGSDFTLSAEQKPVYLVFWAEW